jgi:hypothetical protein
VEKALLFVEKSVENLWRVGENRGKAFWARVCCGKVSLFSPGFPQAKISKTVF